MRLITLDFETYYSQEYSLTKLTTEEYIRDPRFEPLIMGFQVDEDEPQWVQGKSDIGTILDSLDIENQAVLAHHAHFDGFILNHHFGHRPKAWLDTLSMARALHGSEVGGSLGKLVAHYGVGVKDTRQLVNAKGKRLHEFNEIELVDYAGYCCDDVRMTRAIFDKMIKYIPPTEMKLIDMVVRMFTEPELMLNGPKLREYHMTIRAEKSTLLIDAGVTLDEVMSNEKFAQALKRAGVTPPMKRSPTTGQMTYAFAKTDQGLLELQEHPSDQVQALVAARLGNKSTLNETRTLRMAEMAERGPATVYLKFSGAQQTHRLSGGDSMNWQNNQRGGVIRDSIEAPDGYVLVVADSRNIESRVVDTLAKQKDAVQAYRDYDAGHGPDIYCVMAGKIYRREITEDMKPERQFGKVVKLACGFQMGPERFQETARNMAGLELAMNVCATAVNIYRQSHPMVAMLWNRGQSALAVLATGPGDEEAPLKYLDPCQLVLIEQNALLLPNGLRIRYPEIGFNGDREWTFKSNRGERTKIYGGKIVENVVQALARNIVLEQTLRVSRLAKVPCKLSVHDEGVFLAPEDRADEVKAIATEVMSTSPEWWPDIPVAVEVNIARVYGEAK